MKFASYFDHALLRPEITVDDVKRLCEDAKSARFFSVCVPPYYVSEAVSALDGSPVKVITVIGFPFGYSPTVAKVAETKRGIDEGAAEFDVVINLSAVKSGRWDFVRADIDRMLTACHLRSKKIKFTFETSILTTEEIEKLCEISNDIQPDFVNTSTGFNGPGATVEVVALMRTLLNPAIKIKATGDIRTVEAAKALIDAGADRIGSSFCMEMV